MARDEPLDLVRVLRTLRLDPCDHGGPHRGVGGRLYAGFPERDGALRFLVGLVGLVGNILLDPLDLEIFQGYFAAMAGLVAVMFLRLEILKVALYISRAFIERLTTAGSWIDTAIERDCCNRMPVRNVSHFA